MRAIAVTGVSRRVRKLRPRSRCAVVVAQQPAQPVSAADLGPARGRGGRGDQLIPEPLMVPLPVVVRHELVEGAEEPTLPEEDQAVEALARMEPTNRST